MSRALDIHRARLERWRLAMDLVGPGPLDPHFDDAAAVASSIAPAGRWVDLGAGAGFPAIALADRHPDAHFTLVERRAKRAAFLRQVIHDAQLENAELIEGDAAALPRNAWDGVSSRAYKPPVAYLAEARELLVPGGVAVLLAVDEVPTVEGLVLVSRQPYTVAGRPRCVATYRKA